MYDRPLPGVQVIDLSSGPMAAVGRLLADLGAHVTRVRLSGVTGDDAVGPVIAGHGTARYVVLAVPNGLGCHHRGAAWSGRRIET